MTQNEKCLNAFHSNRAMKSIKIRFSIHFKVYFLTIFAYMSVLSAPAAHLCKKFKCNVFRLLNLSGVPLTARENPNWNLKKNLNI
jgi:hypothetical protein